MAEAVEEVGAVRLFVTIVPLSAVCDNINSTLPPTLNHCFKNYDPGDFFNTLGYKQTSKTPSSDVGFAPNIGHSGLLCAFSAINFKLRYYQLRVVS